MTFNSLLHYDAPEKSFKNPKNAELFTSGFRLNYRRINKNRASHSERHAQKEES